jgi:diaminohydroxyphosphoribosylaminopyrimidine deaminase / 5-amino-6-(5-phosphoribosylamino)uracil reductase
MARALRLARNGLFTTDPNPRVGCVLVCDGEAVGEGWHRRAGGPHAERVALAAAGERARGATAYVTLEPCSHFGRTPPCADALIEAGVARVVAAMVDPNPLVSGRGLKRLQEAGIAVECGLMEQEARALNPGFVKRMEQGLPYCRCKIASSLDGRTAMASGESRWISSEPSRRDVQLLRARSSAILTGVETLLADDPSLNVRVGPDDLPGMQPGEAVRQPIRVVLDTRLRTPASARMLALEGETWIFHGPQVESARLRALTKAGARLLEVPLAGDRIDLTAAMHRLTGEGVNELLLETGPTLAGAALSAGLVDELVLYMAPHLMGDSARPLLGLPWLDRMEERIQLTIEDCRRIGPDLRLRLRPNRPQPGRSG